MMYTVRGTIGQTLLTAPQAHMHAMISGYEITAGQWHSQASQASGRSIGPDVTKLYVHVRYYMHVLGCMPVHVKPL